MQPGLSLTAVCTTLARITQRKPSLRIKRSIVHRTTTAVVVKVVVAWDVEGQAAF